MIYAKIHSWFQFSRKAQPKITFRIFMQIFILALLGLVPYFNALSLSDCILGNPFTINFAAKINYEEKVILVVPGN